MIKYFYLQFGGFVYVDLRLSCSICMFFLESDIILHIFYPSIHISPLLFHDLLQINFSLYFLKVSNFQKLFHITTLLLIKQLSYIKLFQKLGFTFRIFFIELLNNLQNILRLLFNYLISIKLFQYFIIFHHIKFHF